MRITFDQKLHQYKIDGFAVPSVTKILQSTGMVDFSNIPSDVLERARNFGIAVHRACELDDANNLDMATVDEALLPYLHAWRKFKVDMGFQILHNEHIVASKTYKYAGCIDRVGRINYGVLSIVDLKTSSTVSPITALQTAGYKIAYEEMTGEKIKKRMAVKLMKTGKYDLHVYPNPNDEVVFLACLQLKNWKEINR